VSEIADTIVVLTARSADRIIREGGSQAWVLNPIRARQCAWLVCAQNRHNKNHDERYDGTEPHGMGFLLGRISAIRKAPEDGADSDRWQIAISEFARINVPHAWNHGRNPVRYTSLASLGFSLDGIEFHPMPRLTEAPRHSDQPTAIESEPMLTITEAKKRLAATFGVKPDAVEIVIRG